MFHPESCPAQSAADQFHKSTLFKSTMQIYWQRYSGNIIQSFYLPRLSLQVSSDFWLWWLLKTTVIIQCYELLWSVRHPVCFWTLDAQWSPVFLFTNGPLSPWKCNWPLLMDLLKDLPLCTFFTGHITQALLNLSWVMWQHTKWLLPREWCFAKYSPWKREATTPQGQVQQNLFRNTSTYCAELLSSSSSSESNSTNTVNMVMKP